MIDTKREEKSKTQPPSFAWKKERMLLPIEILAVPEDTIQVCITSTESLQALIKEHNSKSLSVSYNLGFPREAPLTGKTENVNYNSETESADFGYEVFLPFKLTRSSAAMIVKRKAEFSLILHKGFFPFYSQ